ncbi:putative invertase inhibitor [Phoenix dactylifera]|uniref:Invertase inhibitor n=1 Tax=Phoenix dactylifera TaxID=42345 RepID=A0A8B7BZP5_PHODC|nr:putative invertase inhibitor [Phoenix dactylifera]
MSTMIQFTSFLLSLFFFFLLLNQTNSPMVAATHPDIILKTCKRCAKGDPNLNYTLCVESLASVPKSHHSDVRGLAIVAVKLSKAKTMHAKSMVKKLLKAKPMEGYMKNCLLTCTDVYSDSISDLKDSMKAIKSGQYKDANIRISSAVDAPGNCEDSFQDGNIKSPLMEENKDVFGLAVIALGITALLG